MQHVSAVVVGSQALFDYAKQFSQNVHLIPSSIYLKYYQPAQEIREHNDRVCLGWIGNGKHYKQDLITILQQPLTEISQKYNIRFKLIGACGEQDLYNIFQNIPRLEFDAIDQIKWSDPQVVARELQDINIGLYPLLPNEFNKYKCGFKALEYMAMRIPVISSDVAENQNIIEHSKTGLFTNTRENWVEQIEYLLNHKEIRLRIGNKGRQKVKSVYSIDVAAEKFYSPCRQTFRIK